MLVGVYAVGPVPGRPAVVGFAQAHIGVEEMVLVLGIDPQAPEPPFVAAVATGMAPGRERVTTVVGHVEALVQAVLGAADHVDPLGVARGDRHTDPAEAGVTGEARTGLVGGGGAGHVLQTCPVGAAVLGAEEAGADSAVDPGAVVAVVIPQRGEDPVVVRRIDRQVDAAGRVVGGGQDEVPSAAAVQPVDPALTRRARRGCPRPPRRPARGPSDRRRSCRSLRCRSARPTSSAFRRRPTCRRRCRRR